VGPVFVLTGAPGAGKSTVARALAARFERAFVIPMDDLREWVVSGREDPGPNWNEETTRQFDLAYHAAADLADRYSRAGFAVIIEHVVFPNEEEKLRARLSDREYRTVMLDCRAETNHHRNQTRTGKNMNPHDLTPLIDHIRDGLQPAAHWLRLDSTDLTVEETVDRIINS
jgi:predicted kinase